MNNIIVISDTHFGCQLALCPPKVRLDNGGKYQASALQIVLWDYWKHFWGKWVPQATKGEPYIIVHNGDLIDGVHHNSVTQISQNLTDQQNIASEVMTPIVKNPKCKGYYHVRGTEAHVGKSGQFEEKVAQELGAIPDEKGNYARWDLWLRMKASKSLIHFTHHVGTTNSAAYESTSVYKELVESYTEAGKQGLESPDVIVRSHRHRSIEIRVPTKRGYGIALVTPAWQLRTPFTFRVGLGRSSTPQIGGVLIRCGDEDSIFTRSWVQYIDRDKEEVV